jgi:hypothetical protein
MNVSVDLKEFKKQWLEKIHGFCAKIEKDFEDPQFQDFFDMS